MLDFYYGDDETEIQVGIDEAGRGCFAGPVVAAAVCWDTQWLLDNQNKYIEIDLIRDSKKMSKKQRNQCFDFIVNHTKEYKVGFISNSKIDNINILNATYDAMHTALDDMTTIFERIIIDGNSFRPYLNNKAEVDSFVIPHVCIVKGDNKFFSIACASIVAKVSRDTYILDLCEQYPMYQQNYDWINNKCYGTKKHLEGINLFGITDLHRKTYGICKNHI
tara:strand:+ start:1616 stop:2275 length:660 start_codon:yes stop_codon:yes gene_type:complete